MYTFSTDTSACVGSQHPYLLLAVSVYVACAQNNFYHFRMVGTRATFGLLAVAAFLELNNYAYS